MYYVPYMYPYAYYGNMPICHCVRQQMHLSSTTNNLENNRYFLASKKGKMTGLKDYGKKPNVVNIHDTAVNNKTFRTVLWTGDNLQVAVMSIDVVIGLEVHPTVDQFLRIEEGQGIVQMGDTKNNLSFERKVNDDYAIMVPAGKWHNLINTGDKPLKLYTIYAPPEHPFGTVHKTKADAIAAEENHY